MNNIKYKKLLLIIIILCVFTLIGCAGPSDYEIKLINGYHAMRMSASNVKIFKEDIKDTTGKAPSIPPYYEDKEEEYNSESVEKIGQDNRYILAKTNKDMYYILDTEKEILLEYLSKSEFEDYKKELNINKDGELKDLDKYEKIR
ncbi:MAG: hypothetical protein ACRCXT_13650 [Paraclostridium sp.]